MRNVLGRVMVAMKTKIKVIFFCVFTWLVYFGLAFVSLVATTSALDRFGFISTLTAFTVSLSVSSFFAVVIVLYQIITIKSEKEFRVKTWISNNRARLTLWYVFSVLFFLSMKAELIWDFEELKTVLSLVWTMMGISIAVFLVWGVIVKEYISQKRPQVSKQECNWEKYQYIGKKREFYEEASNLFKSLTLLTVNLTVLILITARIYVISNSLSLFNQNSVIFSLFLCSNTLLDLFIGVLTPLNEIKKQALTETKATQADVEFQNNFVEDMNKYFVLVGEIDRLQEVDEAQKSSLKEKALYRLLGFEHPDKDKPNDEEQIDDQL